MPDITCSPSAAWNNLQAQHFQMWTPKVTQLDVSPPEFDTSCAGLVLTAPPAGGETGGVTPWRRLRVGKATAKSQH